MATSTLFALLALAFAAAAGLRLLLRRRADAAARTWGWLALVFGAVAWWLAG